MLLGRNPRHFPTHTGLAPVFRPSSLRDYKLPPEIHNIRNRAIPQPPGFEERKPYGYLSSLRPAIRVTVARGAGVPAPRRPLTFAETARRVAARYGGWLAPPTAADLERVSQPKRGWFE